MSLERGSAPYCARNHPILICRWIPDCQLIDQPGGCCCCDFSCAFLCELANKLNDGEQELRSRSTGRSHSPIN